MAFATTPNQIDVSESFIAQQRETLRFRQSTLHSGFDVVLANGQLIFRVDEEGLMPFFFTHWSIHDMYNNHVFDFVRELFHMTNTFLLKRPRGETIMEIKSAGKPLGDKATGTFRWNNGRGGSLTMKRNSMASTAQVFDDSTGAQVASIHRTQSIWMPSKYSITVEPGVDMALILAMSLSMEYGLF